MKKKSKPCPRCNKGKMYLNKFSMFKEKWVCQGCKYTEETTPKIPNTPPASTYYTYTTTYNYTNTAKAWIGADPKDKATDWDVWWPSAEEVYKKAKEVYKKAKAVDPWPESPPEPEPASPTGRKCRAPKE